MPLTFKLEEIQTMPQWQGLHDGNQHPYYNLQEQPIFKTSDVNIHVQPC